MQMTRSVFLNYKAAAAALTAASANSGFRLSSLLEISFTLIGRERSAALRRARTLLLEITTHLRRQLLNLREHGFEHVAHLFDTLECFFRCEEQRLGILSLQYLRNLIPMDGHRHVRTVRFRAQRVDANRGLEIGVLAPVDKYSLRA